MALLARAGDALRRRDQHRGQQDGLCRGGGTEAPAIRSGVDLPEPFAPTSTVVVPDGATRSTPSSTHGPRPYRLRTSRSVTTQPRQPGPRVGTAAGRGDAW
jgi:hypothetical protein